MNDIVLGNRLQTIVDMAQNAKTIADIGCDHGKVAVTLAKKGAKVIASDISNDSLRKARVLAKKHLVENNIEFYCSDGLDKVPVSTDCIIISGMGEHLIIDIIENDFKVASSAKSLILLPMDSTFTLREYLMEKGFCINDERLALDENRLYTVLKVSYNAPYQMSLIQQIIGPKIIENRDILIDLLTAKELKKRTIKLKGLQSAKIPDVELIELIKTQIDEIEKLKDTMGDNK